MVNDSDVVMKIQTVGNCSKMTQFFIKLIVRGEKTIEQGPWMSDDVKELIVVFFKFFYECGNEIEVSCSKIFIFYRTVLKYF